MSSGQRSVATGSGSQAGGMLCPKCVRFQSSCCTSKVGGDRISSAQKRAYTEQLLCGLRQQCNTIRISGGQDATSRIRAYTEQLLCEQGQDPDVKRTAQQGRSGSQAGRMLRQGLSGLETHRQGCGGWIRIVRDPVGSEGEGATARGLRVKACSNTHDARRSSD